MVKVNYHLHSTGSDGKLSPKQVVEQAIKAGIKHLCFTDHYPEPKEIRNWGQEKFHSDKYFEEIKKLKEKYKAKIDISLGAEFEFVENFGEWFDKEIKRRDYDYLIGSVHLTKISREYGSIDYTPKAWIEYSEKAGSIRKLVENYYKRIRLLVESGLFDGIGHLDLIKIFNENSRFFSETESWYKQEVLRTLDLIEKKKMCLEINTSGWRKPCKEQYPSVWILKEVKKRNIPITIGTDGHQKVDEYLDEGIELAKKLGFESVLIFHKRKPIEVKL